MQLDIFDDGRATMLRNDVAHAVIASQPSKARQARQALQAASPDDASLEPLAVLIGALEAEADETPFAGHAACTRACRRLEDAIAPAARQQLGDGAAGWLAQRWRHAAGRAAALPYDGGHPDVHAAALWLRAQDAAAAQQAASSIESWRRIPAPLAWRAQACMRLHGLDEAWPLLAELAWLAPERFARVARELADVQLGRLLAQFGRAFEGRGDATDLAWFPAWVLTERPALHRRLSAAQAQQHEPPEQAMRLLAALIGLEHRGRQHDLVDKRKQLRDLNDGLFAAYMARR